MYSNSLKKYILLSVFVLVAQVLHAQPNSQNVDYQMAVQFYDAKEYDKAADVFERLYKKNAQNLAYYNYLYNCFVGMKDFEKAEKLAKIQLKKDPTSEYKYYLDQAFALKLAAKNDKADDIYKNIVKNAPNNPNQILDMVQILERRNEINFATETLENLRKKLDNPQVFAVELAELYYKATKPEKCFATYLNLIEIQPEQADMVQNALQDKITADADKEKFRVMLIKKVQQNPDNTALSELLVWYFVQQNNFLGAFNQLKALEKRTNGDYTRIFNLANEAVENSFFSDALEMYKYISSQGEAVSPYFFVAQTEYLNTYKKMLDSTPSTTKQYEDLSKDYQAFFTKNGFTAQNIGLQSTYASLLAYQLFDANKAIEILDNALKINGLNPKTIADLKLELADLYLITGDVWEPTLLYGQVEKTFKDEPLGQQAKFKNAKLSFYRGEFEWSKAQCDVLKASTAQKISNDAIQLSLLIQDNIVGDTVLYALKMYAAADLYVFQNKLDSANVLIDTLLKNFEKHSIVDDALFLKAQTCEKQQNYSLALGFYTKITQNYADDILADDALFAIATIYDQKLGDKTLAQDFYKQLLLKHPDSLYSQDARKRIRVLRGDVDNAGEQQQEYLKN